MKLRIFNTTNPERAFINLRFTKNRFGDVIPKSEYKCVYDGEIDAVHNLEDVYVCFNTRPVTIFVGHSMSVSDVVEVVDSNEVSKGFYYCDSFGFEKVRME